jgi:hypothetical protein
MFRKGYLNVDFLRPTVAKRLIQDLLYDFLRKVQQPWEK